MKFKIFFSLIFIYLAISDPIDSNIQVLDTQNDQCTNKCEACQKAIYQMKFHQVADCGSSHCISTCDNVRKLWSQSQFDDFKKDIFGKCEICFRAGFCTISECSVQKQLEENIIKRVVNKSHLTGVKKNIVTELGFDKFNKNLQAHSNEEKASLENELQSFKSDLTEGLSAAFSVNSIAIVNSRINDTIGILLSPDNIYTQTTCDKKEVAQPKSEEVAETFKGTATKIQTQIEQLLANNKMTDELKLSYIEKLKGWNKNLNNLLKNAEKSSNSELTPSINESLFIFTNLMKKLTGKPPASAEIADKNDNAKIVSIEPKSPSPKKKRRAQKKRY